MSNIGVIKVIDSMSAVSEFNLLVIFPVYEYCVFNSSIHRHAMFGCNDRHGDQVGYLLWVLLYFKFRENIE